MINPGQVAPGASELSAHAELSGRGATWGAPIGRILPQDKTGALEIFVKNVSKRGNGGEKVRPSCLDGLTGLAVLSGI